MAELVHYISVGDDSEAALKSVTCKFEVECLERPVPIPNSTEVEPEDLRDSGDTEATSSDGPFSIRPFAPWAYS